MAISRNGTDDRSAINNYSFELRGDQRLTEWMIKNLKIGYWIAPPIVTYQDLRNNEMNICRAIKPSLDLDKRTVRYNNLASQLIALRQVCKDEALNTLGIEK